MKLIEYGLELDDDLRHPVLIVEKEYDYNIELLISPEKVAEMCNRIFRLKKRAEEYVIMLAVDSGMRPLGLFQLSHGTVNYSMSSPREMLIRCLLCGAAGILIVHNHPSLRIEPSEEDRRICEKIKKAADMIDLKLYDFLIVGDGYYSFRKENVL